MTGVPPSLMALRAATSHGTSSPAILQRLGARLATLARPRVVVDVGCSDNILLFARRPALDAPGVMQ